MPAAKLTGTEQCQWIAEALSECPPELEGSSVALLAEWVVVTAWVDADDGSVYYARREADGQPTHHTEGLLRVGLEYWDMDE